MATIHFCLLTKEKWKHIFTQRYTHMIIAALYVVSLSWKYPRYLLSDEWISKLWYNHTVGYRLAIQLKEYTLQHGYILK